MSDYLKLFQAHSAYNTYINGNNVSLPNVSFCQNENEIHYNPRDYSREYSRGYEEDYSNTYPIYKMARDDEHESGYSYRRGRDSMGRYTSRDDGYSRHSKAEMIEDLKEMMMNARTEEERESYRKTIDNLTRN